MKLLTKALAVMLLTFSFCVTAMANDPYKLYTRDGILDKAAYMAAMDDRMRKNGRNRWQREAVLRDIEPLLDAKIKEQKQAKFQQLTEQYTEMLSQGKLPEAMKLLSSMYFLDANATNLIVGNYANLTWQPAALPGLVAFAVPPGLEEDVRTNNMRDHSRGPGICFHSQTSYQYAFVGVECKFLGEDSGARIGKPLEHTQADLDAMREGVLNELRNDPYNNRYFDISNVRVVRTNWGEAFFLSYKRQLNYNPAVQIYRYMTFDEDKFYDITISYRIDEFNYWCQEGNDIRQVINTMKFVKF